MATSTPSTPARRGRVRLRRTALMGVPAAAAAAVLVVLTAQGAIAAQFSISGIPFTVTATQLKGTGFEQYGGLDNMTDGSPNAGDTGGQEVVVVSAIKDATLTNLCQSVNLGGINMVINAGNGSTPVSAHDLVTDSSEIFGNASFHDIEIGGDASTFTKGDSKGPQGDFGQQANTVTINNLRQTNYATTAATFKLPGLHLSFKDEGC
jgi:Family of unknown function (DUF6230)